MTGLRRAALVTAGVLMAAGQPRAEPPARPGAGTVAERARTHLANKRYEAALRELTPLLAGGEADLELVVLAARAAIRARRVRRKHAD